MKYDSIIQILVVEHRSVVSSGIVAVLSSDPGLHVVGKAGNEAEMLRLCEKYHPDLVTIDVDLPGESSGTELIRTLRHQYTGMQIVVLTNRLEEAILLDALRAGAVGYLLKDIPDDEFVQAIRDAYQGIPTLAREATRLLIHAATSRSKQVLTQREHQVLELIVQGASNHEIARRLAISSSTVQFHVANILAKLNVTNRAEAAAFAVSHQITAIQKTGNSNLH